MTDREYLICLSYFSPFGAVRLKLLLNYFGTAKKVWNASEEELLQLNLSPRIVNNFVNFRKNFDIKKTFELIDAKNISTLTLEEADYPENLKELPDAPVVLFVRGKIKKSDANAVAIVGSRKMTTYGREVTEKFARELSEVGVTIVSGLAFGVDLYAHQSAVNAGGRCIAVLAGGVDKITPRSNEWLGEKIIEGGSGAVISEFPPGTIPQKHFFPFRNRLISGLSKAVIVVEVAVRSGTLHTVSHALSQGRQVFAVPGQITSPMSEGPNYLIKEGSKMATSTKDILDELNLQLSVDLEAVNKVLPGSEKEEKLLLTIANENMHIDEVSRILGLTAKEVSATLTIMELKGMVRSMGGGIYKKC